MMQHEIFVYTACLSGNIVVSYLQWVGKQLSHWASAVWYGASILHGKWANFQHKKEQRRKDFLKKSKNILPIFLSAFIVTIPVWWFSVILRFWGEDLKLMQTVNNKTDLTLGGIVLTVLVMGGVLFYTILQKYKEQKVIDVSSKLKESEEKNKIYSTVSNALCEICDFKVTNKLNKIKYVQKSGVTAEFFDNDHQMAEIKRNLETCIKQLLNTYSHENDEKDLYASILYRFPALPNSEDGWFWAVSARERGLEKSQLLRPDSTFSRLLESDEPYLIFNSKSLALKQKSYIPDDNDKKEELKGSIVCYRIKAKLNDIIYLDAVVGISTYQKPFVYTNDENEINNIAQLIKTYVIDVFEKQICIELCNCYMRRLYTQDSQYQNQI